MLNLKSNPLFKRFLYVPLLFVLVTTVLLSTAAMVQSEVLTQAQIDNDRAIQNVRRTLQKVRFLRNQEQLFLQYGSQYNSVMEEGLVHDFDRLKWVDGLLKIQKQLVISPFIIQVEPEAKLQATDFENYKLTKDIFYFTRVNIVFGFQVDEDLIRFQKLIAEQISPLFFTEQCQIGLPLESKKELTFNPHRGGVLGECSLIVFQAKPNRLKVDGS